MTAIDILKCKLILALRLSWCLALRKVSHFNGSMVSSATFLKVTCKWNMRLQLYIVKAESDWLQPDSTHARQMVIQLAPNKRESGLPGTVHLKSWERLLKAQSLIWISIDTIILQSPNPEDLYEIGRFKTHLMSGFHYVELMQIFLGTGVWSSVNVPGISPPVFNLFVQCNIACIDTVNPQGSQAQVILFWAYHLEDVI